MKNKKWILFFIGIFILFSLSTYAQTKKLRQIGRYKLVDINGDITQEELMKTLVDRYQGDIKYGFDLTGSSDLFPLKVRLRRSTTLNGRERDLYPCFPLPLKEGISIMSSSCRKYVETYLC
jgi:hypothetical protein